MGGMENMPTLFDRTALHRNRARADADALFLHDTLAAELHERLNEVNRTFTSVAIVTGFPDLWAQAFPNATIVADDDVLALEPGAHDLVLHVMALHWANDPVGQLVQCRHALKPDGLLLCGFLGGQTLHELRATLASPLAVFDYVSDRSSGVSTVLSAAASRVLALPGRRGCCCPSPGAQPVNVISSNVASTRPSSLVKCSA
jgi:hypothetical protein